MSRTCSGWPHSDIMHPRVRNAERTWTWHFKNFWPADIRMRNKGLLSVSEVLGVACYKFYDTKSSF
jgi:hypothetical protein